MGSKGDTEPWTQPHPPPPPGPPLKDMSGMSRIQEAQNGHQHEGFANPSRVRVAGGK